MGDFARDDREGTFISTGPTRGRLASWSVRPASTSRPARGPGVGPAPLRGQADPQPRRLARDRDLRPRTWSRSRSIASARFRRPPAEGARAAQPGRRRRRPRGPAACAPGAVRRRRQQPEHHYLESTFDKGPELRRRGRPPRAVPRVRPGDPPTRRQRSRAAAGPFFSSPAASTSAGSAATRSTSAWAAPRTEIQPSGSADRELRILEPKGDFVAILRKLLAS